MSEFSITIISSDKMIIVRRGAQLSITNRYTTAHLKDDFDFSVKAKRTMIRVIFGQWAVYCTRWLVCRKRLKVPTYQP